MFLVVHLCVISKLHCLKLWCYYCLFVFCMHIAYTVTPGCLWGNVCPAHARHAIFVLSIMALAPNLSSPSGCGCTVRTVLGNYTPQADPRKKGTGRHPLICTTAVIEDTGTGANPRQ